MKKAVVLLSGGLDSLTCLAIAKHEGFSCYTLSFDYGQRHCAELTAAEAISKKFKVIEHKCINLSVNEFKGSALTDYSIPVPQYSNSNIIPVTYVPARNTTFLSIALGWAEVIDAEAIFIGVSSVDYSGYPDCRPQYIAAFQNLANLATKAAVEDKRYIKIHTPLIHLSKAQTITLGHGLGVNYFDSVSCYQATSEGLACGSCDSCVLRRKGFMEAAIEDKTRYL